MTTEQKKVSITIDTYSWDYAEEDIQKEKRICYMVEKWGKENPPPISFKISADWGYRAFIHPFADAKEDEKRALVRWFVKSSGKKFVRFFREESGKLAWWNLSSAADRPENEQFEDSKGKLNAVFLIENMALGKCKIVEETKTIKVKKLVCEE